MVSKLQEAMIGRVLASARRHRPTRKDEANRRRGVRADKPSRERTNQQRSGLRKYEHRPRMELQSTAMAGAFSTTAIPCESVRMQ